MQRSAGTGQDRDGDGDSWSRVDRSYRIPCTLCGATCDRRRRAGSRLAIGGGPGKGTGSLKKDSIKHWQPISSFPTATPNLGREPKSWMSWHFNAAPGAKLWPSFHMPCQTETICASNSLANGWDMSWRVGQFDNTEAASQVTSPLSHCRFGGKKAKVFLGQHLPGW